MEKMMFSCDYQEGAHPAILERLVATNMEQAPGYGMDAYSESAKEKIRAACACPDAAVYFLVGGTQTNAVMIDALLRRYQGVISADTGHISVHEAGAIEFCGHKILPIPHQLSKISAEAIDQYCATYWGDANYEHMVMPGMVYLSQPTEYGTLYSLKELEAIREVCLRYKMTLYIDGARLAYALAAEENDVTLPDLARLCDAFYIGGTKCGALVGEAVVLPNPALEPHLFTIIKQHGALLAKGRLVGIQYDVLFENGLYAEIGQNALVCANRLRDILKEKGYVFPFETPTNQIFVILENEQLRRLEEHVVLSFWEKYDDTHTVVRFATSWATKLADVEALREIL